jgi:ribosomal protein L14
VLDNTGVKKVKVFHLKGNRRFGVVGDIFLGSVLKSNSNSRYKKGDIVRGLFITTVKGTKFFNHSKSLKFLQNSCVLVSDSNEPLGSRITSISCDTLRKTGLTKVLSLVQKSV